MSSTTSFGVINQKVEKIFAEEKTENKGMAFTILCLRTLFNLTDEEIEETITDGPMDGEIDAIYISNRVIHILTFKYTDDFLSTKKNYPEKELDQFVMTVDKYIEGELNHKTINDAVWDKYQETIELTKKGSVSYKVYVVSNKLHPVPHAKLKLEDMLKAYQINEKPVYLDQDSIVNKILAKRKEPVNGTVQFIRKQHFEKSDGVMRTVIGVIPALDLMKLIVSNKNSKEINEEAFNENVRVYKPNHSVNKDIINSAQEKNNYLFFYLNNGITILCEKIDYTPGTSSPPVVLTNLQIINGGQTSHSLFEVYKNNPKKLEAIEILVRICKIDHEDPNKIISQKISESTNNQIPVGSRDLHSNDHIQQKLEEEFSELGYFYERKPNKHIDQPKNKVLNNEMLGQLFMAYHLDMPSEAKNNKSKVFTDLYESIFNETVISAEELLRLYNLYLPLLEKKKEIQKKKRKRINVPEKEAFISRATFHILNGAKYLFESEEKRIENLKETAKEKKILKTDLYKKSSVKFIKKSTSMIYQIVKREMRLRGKEYTHDKFFKEIPTNTIIKNYFNEKITVKLD